MLLNRHMGFRLTIGLLLEMYENSRVVNTNTHNHITNLKGEQGNDKE